MVRSVSVTGDGNTPLYVLCAMEVGNNFPPYFNSMGQDDNSPWPDPVQSLQVTGTGTLKDSTTGDTLPALPFNISDSCNSISLQTLIPSDDAAMVVVINVR